MERVNDHYDPDGARYPTPADQILRHARGHQVPDMYCSPQTEAPVRASVARMGQGESAAPGAASAARAGVWLSFAGRSGSASRQSRSRNELRYSPLTRIPLPSHAAAAACPRRTPVPPAIRRAGLRALPATGHDFGSLLRPARDLAPRPVALCTPNGIVEPARYPRDAALWPSRERPPSRATATWRSVPLRRVDRTAARLRRGTSGTFRCRHKRPTSVRRRPWEGQVTATHSTMSIITPASVACLADPLPPLAWMPI